MNIFKGNLAAFAKVLRQAAFDTLIDDEFLTAVFKDMLITAKAPGSPHGLVTQVEVAGPMDERIAPAFVAMLMITSDDKDADNAIQWMKDTATAQAEELKGKSSHFGVLATTTEGDQELTLSLLGQTLALTITPTEVTAP